MGGPKRKALMGAEVALALDTFGGRIHVEWVPVAAVTPPPAQLPFSIGFSR
jgi:hypothetical protein